MGHPPLHADKPAQAPTIQITVLFLRDYEFSGTLFY